MRKFFLPIILLATLLLASCMKPVENPTLASEQPHIFPDYIGVTIPVDIAPLDFAMLSDSVTAIDVVVEGVMGKEHLHVNGPFADFDIEEWKELLKIITKLNIITTKS